MARVIALVAVLVVAVVADPIRTRRQTNQLIATAGALDAQGSGWASDNHQAALSAVGIPASSGSGWGQDGNGWGQDGNGWGSGGSVAVPATISVVNAGGSEVGQAGAIVEATSNDGQGNLVGLQEIGVLNNADAGDALEIAMSGGEVSAAASSAADAGGSGALDAYGEVVVIGEGNSNLGMGKPQ